MLSMEERVKIDQVNAENKWGIAKTAVKPLALAMGI